MNNITLVNKIGYYCLLIYGLSSCISVGLSNISLLTATLLAIVGYTQERYLVEIDNRICKGIAIFMAALFVSCIGSTDFSLSIKKWFEHFFSIVPLLLAPYFLRNKRHIINAVIMIGISILIADIYASWQAFHGVFRAPAFSWNAMIFAGYLLQIIPFMLVLSFENCIDNHLKTFFCSTTVLSIIALILNGTRGAWLAVGISVFIYFLLKIKEDIRFLRYAVVFFIPIVVLFWQIPFLYERLSSITDLTMRSNFERILLWRSAWAMFLDNIFMGVGLGQFGESYRLKYILPGAMEPGLNHAHNNIMNLLAETGILGTAAFLFLCYLIIKFLLLRYLKNYDRIALALCLVSISLFIQGLTEYNITHMSIMKLYWFLFGLIFIKFKESVYNIKT